MLDTQEQSLLACAYQQHAAQDGIAARPELATLL